MTMDDDFLGRGWAWPITLDGTGGVALVSAERVVEQSIELILQTMPGERPMRPEFGCGLLGTVFAPADGATAGVVREAVLRALDRWEPRIVVEDVRVSLDGEHELTVEIDYILRATNQRRNLVFPYYVLPDENVSGSIAPAPRGPR
jgi:phage baseplate assembly protein W